MEGSSQANLGSKIRNKNATALNLMKRRNQARKIAERIKSGVRRNNSSLYTPKSNGFSSKKALLQNYANFKHSDTPCRFMFYQNGSWVGLSGEEFGVLKSNFLAGRSMEMVSIEGTEFLFDFLRMLIIDTVTGEERSISWIDVHGKSFFPKFVVGEEDIHTIPETPSCPKVGISKTRTKNNKSLKRKRNILNSSEERPNSSPANQPDVPRSLPLNNRVMERPRWPNVVILNDGDELYSAVKNIFLPGLTRIDPGVSITSIHRCLNLGPLGEARFKVFRNQREMTKAARGIDNTRLAWHGTSSEGVSSIVTYGFGMPSKFPVAESYGVGIYLSPRDLPHISAMQSEVDVNGEKHVILCRVILGHAEQIEVGSQQFHPSSIDFDSGVDSVENPNCPMRYETAAAHLLSRTSSDEPQGISGDLEWKQMDMTKAAIVTHGFAMPSKFSGNEGYGVGIYLSPRHLPHVSATLSKADVNGEKHVILCRVILGGVEKVQAGSRQFHPSSVDFDTDRKKPYPRSLSYTTMEGSSQANLVSKIRTRNATALNLMKRKNQARKIAERIKSGVRRTNSTLYTPQNNGFSSVFSSKKALLQNYSNFKRSDTPSRFMFYQNGSWVGISGDVFGVLKSGFLAGRPTGMVRVEGCQYLFDFLRMLRIDMVTGEQRSISWIDVHGKCFFPESVLGEDTSTTVP
ncbi:hypothetical protein HHK36_031081 [Tetracentron sinense]|uniref:Poly [ADP-ribose] polymerase n=1 Tax=Tetracentron sinense TaxID=13715 RepID=A0A835CZ93_TETSI|nr:hypothetical protein HHK36_031081 [Tetracentron sinense]